MELDLGLLDWGDVLSWLSLALALVLAIAWFANRERIGGWIGRVLFRTPPLPVVSAWELHCIDNSKFRLINRGIGVPRGVKSDANWGDIYLTSKHAWDEFPPGHDGVEIELGQEADMPNLGATISWLVEDRNEPSGWRREADDTKQFPIDRGSSKSVSRSAYTLDLTDAVPLTQVVRVCKFEAITIREPLACLVIVELADEVIELDGEGVNLTPELNITQAQNNYATRLSGLAPLSGD